MVKPELSAADLSLRAPLPWARANSARTGWRLCHHSALLERWSLKKLSASLLQCCYRSGLQERAGSCLAMVIQMLNHSSLLHSRLFMVYEHWGFSCEQEDLGQVLTEFSWGAGQTASK